MNKLNIYGLREYSRGDIFECTTDEVRVADKFYIMNEADEAIEKIIKGAISMFRESDKCRGLDLKSTLGRIANAAFKHWSSVEFIQRKNTQLKEDKEQLLQNNHHLLDEVERLKEDVANARQKACGYQEIINEMERQERHHKYKRCFANAWGCQQRMELFHELVLEEARMIALPNNKVLQKYRSKRERASKWRKRWLALAEKFKENK